MISSNTPSANAPLPPECLEIVLDFLRNDLASLYHLLFVSRQFFQLTVPVLYESPFRLAAGVPDLPLLSFSSSSSTSQAHSHPHSHCLSYDSTTGWARFLERTKLLSRLLIQNLQIKPLGQVPRLTVHKASLLDDSTGLENLEPLIPASDQFNWPGRSSAVQAPSEWSSHHHSLLQSRSLFDGENSAANHHQAQDHYYQCPDLIRFDDAWGSDDEGCNSSSANRSAGMKNGGSSSMHLHRGTATGLLMDYFYFYTHQDHRSIASVIRHVYPGAGRRECDRFMAEIERAILLHNPRQIESIHIQFPNLVIPHLQAHIEQFEQLTTIELLDTVWSIHELAMVHQFLQERAAVFPAGTHQVDQDADADRTHGQGTTALRQGIRRRRAAVRHFKYATIRNHWDDTRLDSQRFDPLQLIKALGPGLETIDSVYWPRTLLKDLESLNVSSLRSLRIGFLDTPREDFSFSRPEFLKRCRQLRTLAVFTSSRDMFSWAVEDWNANKRKRMTAVLQEEVETSAIVPQASFVTPLRKNSLSIAQVLVPLGPPIPPPVALEQLRIHGHTDQIVFEVLRDAFYGFRNTLRILEARSDMEHLEGEAEWMDQATDLLSGRPLSDAKRRSSSEEGNRQQQDSRTTSTTTGATMEMDDEVCYRSLSSISSGSLLIRWKIPHLVALDLTGPIAAVFDLDSLVFMPSLHTVCFSIIIAPSPWVRRTQSSVRGSGGSAGGSSGVGRSNMSQLPMVTGPALRRVLIRGPWHEITDESLWNMIETVCGNDEDSSGRGNGGGDGSGSCRWGDQLIELSILDNGRVTVPGMIRLAQHMDQLQVMGMSLILPVVPNEPYFSSSPSYSSSSLFTSQQPESASSRRRIIDDSDGTARRMITKARLEMPWIDLGPDANHLARRVRRDGYLSRGWDV
ncbi:hypothetical protein BGX28_010490 [Mortierella sp. GBA30]|nr:hypothetical protein BGX28_010490 [Mortierella sp. GBA30]